MVEDTAIHSEEDAAIAQNVGRSVTDCATLFHVWERGHCSGWKEARGSCFVGYVVKGGTSELDARYLIKRP